MADQEFLASFGVEIDESGVGRLQGILEENRTLADELADAFDGARTSVLSFFRDLEKTSFSGMEMDDSGMERLQTALKESRTLAKELSSAFDEAMASVQQFCRSLGEISIPNLDVGSGRARVTEEPAGMNIPVSLDFTKANKELAAFLKEATKAFKLSANGSAVVTAGRNALSSLQSMFASTVLPLKVQIETSGGTGSAAGAVGSAASAATASVAQTGAKAAVSSLESLLNVSSVNAPVMNNSSKTVQAPVSINVTAAGSNPEAVGQSVYNVAEQYLLRTLGGE